MYKPRDFTNASPKGQDNPPTGEKTTARPGQPGSSGAQAASAETDRRSASAMLLTAILAALGLAGSVAALPLGGSIWVSGLVLVVLISCALAIQFVWNSPAPEKMRAVVNVLCVVVAFIGIRVAKSEVEVPFGLRDATGSASSTTSAGSTTGTATGQSHTFVPASTSEAKDTRVSTIVTFGGHPRAITVNSAGAWIATGAGVRHVRDSRQPAGRRPTYSPSVHVAADYAHVFVGLVNGDFDIYDAQSGDIIWNPGLQGATPGPLVARFGSAWALDPGNLAVYRLEPAPDPYLKDQLTKIPLEDEPTAISVGGHFIWVAERDGWVVTVDPETNEVVGQFDVGFDPGYLAFASGTLWVSFPDTGTVVRFDTRSGRALHPAIAVNDSVVALAAANKSIWIASSAPDALQRIDPRRNQVVEDVRLKHPPADMAVDRGRLLVLSERDGVIVRVNPGPLRPLPGLRSLASG